MLGDPRRASAYAVGFAEDYGNRYWLTQRVLWENEWKFVFNGFDFDELYNLETDPYEMENLIGRPEHRDRYRSMMAHTWQWIRDTGDQALAESDYLAMRIAEFGPGA